MFNRVKPYTVYFCYCMFETAVIRLILSIHSGREAETYCGVDRSELNIKITYFIVPYT